MTPVPADTDRPTFAHRTVERLRRSWRRFSGPMRITLSAYSGHAIAVGHFVAFVIVYWAAYSLRFDLAIPQGDLDVFWASLPWVAVLKLATFYLSRSYQGWWRHVTLSDLAALLRASTLSLLALCAVNHLLLNPRIPWSVLVLDWLLTIVLFGAVRSSWRMMREQLEPLWDRTAARRALLIGSDHSAWLLAHQIHSHPHSRYRIRGLISTNGDLRIGTRVGGIPLLGHPDQLRQIADSQRITDVLAIAGSLSGDRLRQLMENCDRGQLDLRIIPPIEDLFSGNRTIPLRRLDINDLLRRDPVTLDSAAIGHLIEGRTVMVTGAGGSIGSEICRQVMRYRPARLVLVGKGEQSIFTIDGELRRHRGPVELETRIGDITDTGRMRRLHEMYRPEVVFHAAAHKHVPLMESNPGEAIKNNVFGTKCVADLAHEFGVQAFTMISTDKAVNPTNIMGMSKHLAERYVHALSQESRTRFTVVRFGNVLGSTGSVVPVFQEQIRRGGPITITDPRMTRFFMTIPEASQLVLQAASMGRGGEIYVLDMGEPVRIVDLARDMIRLSGLPEHAIEIVYTGVRPGEKLFEELYFRDETTLETSHPKIRAAYPRPDTKNDVDRLIQQLEPRVNERSTEIAALLRSVVGNHLSDATQCLNGPRDVNSPSYPA